MAVFFKNQILRWALAVGIVLTIYSLAYFYSTLPSSDSQFFRGLTEYFINTANLNPDVPNHQYFQWPSFFILGYIATAISGLPLSTYEFLLYALIGIIIATGLYIYATKKYRAAGFLVVTAFFFSMFYFFNFQAVPFTLAFGLLMLLFVLETFPASGGITSAKIVLFGSLLLTHAFVPLFYSLYLFVYSIINRSLKYASFFFFSLCAYLLFQLTMTQLSFFQNIINTMTQSAEYSQMVAVTLMPVQIPLDMTAQLFSRFVTLGALVLCGAGFVMILLKRELRTLDKSILIMGVLYSGLGLAFYTLGTRAIAITFIPIALGIGYLAKTKAKPLVTAVLLVLVLSFVFIPLHLSFTNEVQFQTTEAYSTENSFIHFYNWQQIGSILANYRVTTYIDAKTGIPEDRFTTLQPTNVTTILFTPALDKELYNLNSSIQELTQNMRLNIVYNSGSSFVATTNSQQPLNFPSGS